MAFLRGLLFIRDIRRYTNTYVNKKKKLVYIRDDNIQCNNPKNLTSLKGLLSVVRHKYSRGLFVLVILKRLKRPLVTNCAVRYIVYFKDSVKEYYCLENMYILYILIGSIL